MDKKLKMILEKLDQNYFIFDKDCNCCAGNHKKIVKVGKEIKKIIREL